MAFARNYASLIHTILLFYGLATLIARLTFIALKAWRHSAASALIAGLAFITQKAWSNAGSDPLFQCFDIQLERFHSDSPPFLRKDCCGTPVIFAFAFFHVFVCIDFALFIL
jgi:hypothetical protein